MSLRRIGAAQRRGLNVMRGLRYLVVLLIFSALIARLFVVELVVLRGNTMGPAALDGDVLLVNRRATPKIGDMVLIEIGEAAVVRRIVAGSGAFVSSVDGVLAINSSPLSTRTAGTFSYHDAAQADETHEARPRRQQRLTERLEDGRRHEILGDYVGASRPWLLEIPEIEVPPGHVFLLCDNRRLCELGELAGPVRTDAIVGVANTIVWEGNSRVASSGTTPSP